MRVLRVKFTFFIHHNRRRKRNNEKATQQLYDHQARAFGDDI